VGNTSNKIVLKRARDIYYYRQRFKNRVFGRIVLFFAEEAERRGFTRKDIALSLNRDPAQVSRWLSGPSNMTLDTISDLLLAMDAEIETPKIIRFSDRSKSNYAHPLIMALEKNVIVNDDAAKKTIKISLLPPKDDAAQKFLVDHGPDKQIIEVTT
jgi:transcriptional regulator with XRE-family HTH domain